MAYESSAHGSIHIKLRRAQGHTIKGEDRIDLHPLDYTALLRHLRRRALGPESIIHIDCSLREGAYPVIQDAEVIRIQENRSSSVITCWKAPLNSLYVRP